MLLVVLGLQVLGSSIMKVLLELRTVCRPRDCDLLISFSFSSSDDVLLYYAWLKTEEKMVGNVFCAYVL